MGVDLDPPAWDIEPTLATFEALSLITRVEPLCWNSIFLSTVGLEVAMEILKIGGFD